MAELKTKKTKASVIKYLKKVPDAEKRKDSLTLHKIFTTATGQPAAMWGTAIVGYGMYHYQSTRSAQAGDWPRSAFSPRKQNLTLYFMPQFIKQSDLFKKLGKHTVSGGCLYVKRLSDVNIPVLKQLIKESYRSTKKAYPSS